MQKNPKQPKPVTDEKKDNIFPLCLESIFFNSVNQVFNLFMSC